jgi:hypothetical protein
MRAARACQSVKFNEKYLDNPFPEYSTAIGSGIQGALHFLKFRRAIEYRMKIGAIGEHFRA